MYERKRDEFGVAKKVSAAAAANYLKWVCVFTTGGMLDTHLHHFLLWILNRIDVASLFGYENRCCGMATQIARNQSRDFPWINRLENAGELPQRNEKENNGVKGKERKWLSKSSEGKNLSLSFPFSFRISCRFEEVSDFQSILLSMLLSS